MVDLSLDRPGDHLHIRTVTESGIRIGETWYAGPLLLTRDTVREDWPPRSMAELGIERRQRRWIIFHLSLHARRY